jgi:Holliday junction DNA helicase RuvB
MMSEITDVSAGDNELAFESALRPKSLDEFVGQAKVREQLNLMPVSYTHLRAHETG